MGGLAGYYFFYIAKNQVSNLLENRLHLFDNMLRNERKTDYQRRYAR